MTTAPPNEWPIPDEMKKWVGYEFDLGTEEVEAGTIRKFTKAYMDDNLVWRDKQYAKKSIYRGLVAPPTFIHCLTSVGYAHLKLSLPWENSSSLNLSNEFELFEPLRPGDIISGKARVVSILGRLSKRLGRIIIQVVEITYTNQKEHVVAKQRSTGLHHEAQP